MNVSNVLSYLSAFAPTNRALSYDNVGLLIGNPASPVTSVCIALDITLDVVDEAIASGAELIVAHHPVIFTPLKTITPTDAVGAVVYKLIQNNISAICMHTNLDAANIGVNTMLADRVGLLNGKIVEVLGNDEKATPYGIGLYGMLEGEKTMPDFLRHVKDSLQCPALRYCDSGKPVRCVAVGGGSCGDFVTRAPELGIDTIVTADIKHSHFIAAQALGINLIDAGHFHTENPVTDLLYDILSQKFPSLSVKIAKSNHSPISVF